LGIIYLKLKVYHLSDHHLQY